MSHRACLSCPAWLLNFDDNCLDYYRHKQCKWPLMSHRACLSCPAWPGARGGTGLFPPQRASSSPASMTTRGRCARFCSIVEVKRRRSILACACVKYTILPPEVMTVRGCSLDSGTLTIDTELTRTSSCGAFYFGERWDTTSIDPFI